jgi:putative ABC transport system permease protein
VRHTVMRRGLAIGVAGSALGLVGALATNRLLSTLLYDVRPTDVVTLAAMIALLVGIAAVASLIPAHWSARIDPVVALRADG